MGWVRSAARRGAALTATGGLLAAGLTTAVGLPAPAGAAVTAGCPSPGGARVPAPARPDADVVVTGHGLGHGLGMSQYGSQGAARLGCSAARILTTYYAGSRVTTRTAPDEVRLWMLQSGTHALVTAESGPVRWAETGCTTACAPTQPVGATWRVVTDAARTRIALVDEATRRTLWTGAATGAVLVAHHSGTVVRLRTFRGAAPYLTRRVRWDETRFAVGPSGLQAKLRIRTTSVGSAMDKYLWGLGEVPISWTRGAHEALRAQVIAARTYAYPRLLAGATLHPTPVHQHYTGYDQESVDQRVRDDQGRTGRWRAAVDSTSRQVLVTPAGGLVSTFYSSSFGGRSEDVRFVWGSRETSYLRGLDDSRWDLASDNPSSRRSWALGFTRADAARRLGLTTLTSIRVASHASAERLAGVRVTGTVAGVTRTLTYTGWDFRQRMGLPGTNVSVTVRPPVAPPPVTRPPAPATPAVGLALSTGRARHGATVRATALVRRSGAVLAGAEVRLQALRTGTATWTTVASLRTSSTGQAAFTVVAGAPGDYRAYVPALGTRPAASSSRRSLAVSRNVSARFARPAVARGQAVTLAGAVSPPTGGLAVRRQRLVSGRWLQEGTAAVTDPAGRYAMRVAPTGPGTHAYRVVVRAARTLAPGTSPTATLRVG